mmetsp:Transcript_30463/g.94578  ORF Transcript_30463/g.94578 Transcript_30463/m.94578 type:complete len:229 (-) Transcript_30463:5190-5876(-)
MTVCSPAVTANSGEAVEGAIMNCGGISSVSESRAAAVSFVCAWISRLASAPSEAMSSRLTSCCSSELAGDRSQVLTGSESIQIIALSAFWFTAAVKVTTVGTSQKKRKGAPPLFRWPWRHATSQEPTGITPTRCFSSYTKRPSFTAFAVPLSVVLSCTLWRLSFERRMGAEPSFACGTICQLLCVSGPLYCSLMVPLAAPSGPLLKKRIAIWTPPLSNSMVPCFSRKE